MLLVFGNIQFPRLNTPSAYIHGISIFFKSKTSEKELVSVKPLCYSVNVGSHSYFCCRLSIICVCFIKRIIKDFYAKSCSDSFPKKIWINYKSFPICCSSSSNKWYFFPPYG